MGRVRNSYYYLGRPRTIVGGDHSQHCSSKETKFYKFSLSPERWEKVLKTIKRKRFWFTFVERERKINIEKTLRAIWEPTKSTTHSWRLRHIKVTLVGSENLAPNWMKLTTSCKWTFPPFYLLHTVLANWLMFLFSNIYSKPLTAIKMNSCLNF